MIQELTNFVKDLPPAVFSYKLQLEEGLYWVVDRNKEGFLEITERKNFKKDDELDDTLAWCLKAQMLLIPVSPAKIFNPIKKIFGGSCSAFALYFNKKNLTEKKSKTPQSEATLKAAMLEYFKSASHYLESEKQKNWSNEFEAFCTQNLVRLLAESEEFQKSKTDIDVHIIFREPDLEDYKAIYDRYISEKVFNKDDYNIVIERIIYGISDRMSSFDEKKTFLRHKTSPFELNFRVNGDLAKTIWQFYQLRSRGVLPNPIPIFIDKRELNGNVVRILNEEKVIIYSEIIKRLFEDTTIKGDLGGYYLLFFSRGELADLDYVSSFKYDLDKMQISEVFSIGGRQESKIDNIFEFENRVVSRIFDSALVSVYENGGKSLRYFTNFGDSKNPEVKSVQKFFKEVVKKDLNTVMTMILAHRKSFYDYIYKGRRQSLQSHVFQRIMENMVLDDIKNDKEFDKDYAIKEKLNIWFSLYDYFNSSKSNQSDMINKTQNMVVRMKEIAKEESEEAFRDDDEFAFASGQLIRFLLSKNESGNRSHALLEPFLQKTEPGLFKLAIARTFDTYKHALKFYAGSKRYEFDKLMSMVMGYEPKPGTNMKDHLPLILAGYFAKLVFYSDDQANNETTTA